MSTVYEFRPIYATVTTRLTTQTGKAVGQAVAPKSDAPYAVLYPWPDVFREGGLSDANQITVTRFQVTCVGDTMEEAQWMQHKVRAALIGWVPNTAGITATPVELDDDSGVLRDDDRTPPVFYTTDRFRFWLTGQEEESSSSS